MLRFVRGSWMRVAVCAALCALVLILLQSGRRDDAAANGPAERVARPRTTPATMATAAPVDLIADTSTEPVRSDRVEDLPDDVANAEPSDDPRVVALAASRDALAFATEEALQGIMNVNATLSDMLAIASNPVESQPDFDYEDDDAIAFKIRDLPDGMEGHMLVGLQPYEENGRSYRYLQMNLNMPSMQSGSYEGVFRDVPNVSLSISYDTDEPYKPTRFALMLQQPVDIAVSRDRGIDAYSGTYTNGAYYWHDFLKPDQQPLTTTIGIIDGQPASVKTFPGMSPLMGDVDLNRGMLDDLLARLQRNLSNLRGD